MGHHLSKLFYRKKSLAGIDIGQTAVKVMSIDTHGTVTGFGTVDVDPDAIRGALKDGSADFLRETLTKLLGENVTGAPVSRQVVFSIPSGYTYMRTLILPAKAEKALRSAVELEAEQYIPVPLGTLIVDYEIVGRTADAITVLVCAAPRSVIELVSRVGNELGLEVVAIEPSLTSAARLLKETERADLPSVIVDIGALVTDIAVIAGGSIKVTASIPIGGHTFTLDISRGLSVPLEQAYQYKVLHGLSFSTRQDAIATALEPSLSSVLSEVKKITRYYTDRVGGEAIEQLLLVGSGSNIPGIGEYFTNKLVLASRVALPWQKINFGKLDAPARQVRPRYITVAGLARMRDAEIWQ